MKVSFKKKIKENKGFTLIELLVTIVIFVILTGIILFNQGGFNSGIILRNLAYDIALNIKQVQNYGIAVKESQTQRGSFSSYGIYFDMIDNKSFIIFADNDSNGRFTINPQFGTSCPVGDPECIQKYSISRGSSINRICLDIFCEDTATELTILFKRPDPHALIYVGGDFIQAVSRAIIEVSSAGNAASTSIVVTQTGQIYVR